MLQANDKCCLIKSHKPLLMVLRRYIYTTSYASMAWMMQHDIVWRHFQIHTKNVICVKFSFMLPVVRQCHMEIHKAMNDFYKLIPTCHDWCIHVLDDVSWHSMMSLIWCADATADACRPLLLLYSISQRWLPKDHSPCLIMSDISRFKYRPTDGHTQ